MLTHWHLGEQVDPLAYRCGRFQWFAGAFVTAAPTHQQVLASGKQGFKQHIAILVSTAGISQQPLLFHQVESGALALAREGARIQSHQHQHLVGNRPHRFQGTDGEGTGAMPKTTTAFTEAFCQHLSHHRCRELKAAVPCHLTPVREYGMDGLQFPSPVTTVSKQRHQLWT